MQKTNEPLMRSFKKYGGNAQKIYDECCALYGWDSGKRGSFAQQKWLYARGVTPEGYSVWFLCNNNMTGTANDKWYNVISHNWDTIEQFSKNPPPDEPFPDVAPRVVFAKCGDGQYRFLGVYNFSPARPQIMPDGKTEWVNVHTCISRRYPIAPEA